MANLFPKWSNTAPITILICLVLTVGTVIAGVTYYATPKYTRVGYQPIQPVAFDHSLHVTQLGMDCRYCHTYVDRSEHSNVPATSTCMNCHNQVQANSPKLAPVRNSYESGEPIPWVKIHRTPDYVYFNHSVHVNRGISCVHCHGEIQNMEEVFHAKSLSMAFCLECHRNTENFIRPIDEVTNLNFKYDSREEQIEQGTKFVHDWKVNPPQSCSGCHR